MRVVLTPPDPPADVHVRTGPLVLLPDDLRRWIREVLAPDAPTGTTLEIVAERETTTITGWPLRLVETRVLDHGTVRAELVVALYGFFEHGGFVVVRGAGVLGAQRDAIAAWLASARPVLADEITALSEVWDLAGPGPAATVRPVQPARPDPRFGAEARLAELAGATAPEARLERVTLLLDLGRAVEALAELGTTPEPRLHARALAQLGRLDEAGAAWREAIALDPSDGISRYNLGLALFERGELEEARTSWREALALSPDDFLILRKIIQAEYRLERWDEAAATRRELRALWQRTRDPRAQLMHEVVIDQIEAGGHQIFAFETFRPLDPSFHPVLRFVAVDAHGHELPHSVVIETSDYAKERGTPFVLVVRHGGSHRTLGATSELPPYPELRATALELLSQPSDRTAPPSPAVG